MLSNYCCSFRQMVVLMSSSCTDTKRKLLTYEPTTADSDTKRGHNISIYNKGQTKKKTTKTVSKHKSLPHLM